MISDLEKPRSVICSGRGHICYNEIRSTNLMRKRATTSKQDTRILRLAWKKLAARLNFTLMIVTGPLLQPPDIHTNTHTVLLDGSVTFLRGWCSGFLVSQSRVVRQHRPSYATRVGYEMEYWTQGMSLHWSKWKYRKIILAFTGPNLKQI
jgi:hypothetical protein